MLGFAAVAWPDSFQRGDGRWTPDIRLALDIPELSDRRAIIVRLSSRDAEDYYSFHPDRACPYNCTLAPLHLLLRHRPTLRRREPCPMQHRPKQPERFRFRIVTLVTPLALQ